MAGGEIPRYMAVTPVVADLDKFAQDVNKVASIVDSANKRISAQGAKFSPFKIDTKSMQRGLASITSQFTNMWKSFDARSNIFSNFGSQLTQMGRSIRYFAFDFERLGRTLTVGLTVPLVAAGAAMVKWGSDFEQSLRKVEVLVDQNRETVTKWGQEILTTMAGLGQSPNELAEGLFFAASAFGSMADKAPVMEVLRSAAAGATIGLGKMEDVTRLLTASVNAYAHENLGAAEAMYVLVKTVTEGNFQADKLATSLGRVLGSATALKIPFRDLVTYIAGITRIGEDPSRIITSLNSALLKMLNPTSKAQEILEYYGYTLEGIKDTLATPGGLLNLLNEFRDTMSDQAFGQLFTNRAVRTALVATDALRAEMQQINDSMTKSEKKRLNDIETFTRMKMSGMNTEYANFMLEKLEADKFYADQLQRLVIQSTDTVQGQTKILKDTIQSISIGAFQSVVQKPLLDFLKQLNQQFLSLNQVVQQNPMTIRLILGIGAGLAALGPGTIILARLVQSLTVFTNVAGLVFRMVGYLSGSLINLFVKGFGAVGTTVLRSTSAMLSFFLMAQRAAFYVSSLAAVITGKALFALSAFGLKLVVAARGASHFAASVAALQFTRFVSFFGTLGTAAAKVTAGMAGFAATLSPVLAASAAAAAAIGGITLAFGGLLVAGGKIRQAVKPIAEQVSGGFNQLREESKTWGEGLMATYSNGIIRGAAYVVRALTSIANIITGMLRPKSPPKILPEIDMWGRGTMEAWLEGWGKADFSVLGDIMGNVERYLNKVLVFEDEDRGEGIVAQMVLGSQNALIDAINQVKNTGQVAKDVLENIFASLGTTTPALRGYISAQLRVAAATNKIAVAQKKLNDVTEKYEALLKPLNRRLERINAQQEERARGQREEELKNLLEQEIPDEIRTAALLELEEIGIERQISNLEQQQADATAPLEDQVTIAEQELAAAQEQLDYFEGLMGLQENQATLLETIADSLKEAKDELEEIKEKLKEGLELGAGVPIEDALPEAGEGIDFSGVGTEIVGEFDAQIASLMEEVEGMKEAWGGLWDAVTERWNVFRDGPLADIKSRFDEFKNNTLIPVANILAEGMDTAAANWDEGLGGLVDEGLDWSIIGVDANGQTFPEYWNATMQEAFGGMTAVTAAQNAVNTINDVVLPAFFELIQGAINVKNEVGNMFLRIAGTWNDGITYGLIPAYNDVKTTFGNMTSDAETMKTNVVTSLTSLKDQFIEGLKGMVSSEQGFQKENTRTRSTFGLNTYLMGARMSNFEATYLAVKLSVSTATQGLMDKFQEWWDLMDEIKTFIVDNFNKALEAIKDWLDGISGAASATIEWFGALRTEIQTLIDESLANAQLALENFLTALTNIGNYVVGGLSDAVSSIGDIIDGLVQDVLNLIDRLKEAIGLKGKADAGDAGGQNPPRGTGGSGVPEESFGFQALAAEEVFGYNPSSSYPVNTSPFRNINPVSSTGIASGFSTAAAHDESVSVVVSPGASAVLDGGVQINFGDVNISNGMELAEFEARVERVITNSITR